MPQPDSARLRLRRAFRYGYFAFLVGVAFALALLAVWFLSRDAAPMLTSLLSSMSFLPMVALIVLGLCVPLFLACWSVIGTAVLRHASQQRSLTDGLAD